MANSARWSGAREIAIPYVVFTLPPSARCMAMERRVQGTSTEHQGKGLSARHIKADRGMSTAQPPVKEGP